MRRWLLAGTKRRATLAQITTAKPELFLPFEAALLRLGEESGALETCLRLLADYFAAEHRLVLWLRKKLSYPTFQAFAAVVIGPLPWLFTGHPARYVVTAGGGVVALIVLGGVLLRAVARWYGARPKLVRARLLRALATAVEAGLPLDRAVALAVDAADSRPLRAHVAAQGARVGHQPLARTFEGFAALPREAIAAMHVAEASGNYGDTLTRLAALYDGDFGK